MVAGFGLATLGFGLSRSFALSLVCLFFTGVFDNVSVVIRLTLEQTITPDHLRGRVSAINYVFIGFSNEFGAFESGATAALFGPTLSVVGGGVATLLVVAIVSGHMAATGAARPAARPGAGRHRQSALTFHRMSAKERLALTGSAARAPAAHSTEDTAAGHHRVSGRDAGRSGTRDRRDVITVAEFRRSCVLGPDLVECQARSPFAPLTAV